MNMSMLDTEQLENVLVSAHPSCLQCVDDGAAAHSDALDLRKREVRQRLAAARELLLRNSRRHLIGTSALNSPQAVNAHLRLHFATLSYEAFIVLYLDSQHRVIDCVELFKGTLTQVSVYPREAVRTALALDAAAVIVAHNHPGSGIPEPSRADESLTHALKSALALVDVRLIGHIVFGDDTFASLAQRGLL